MLGHYAPLLNVQLGMDYATQLQCSAAVDVEQVVGSEVVLNTHRAGTRRCCCCWVWHLIIVLATLSFATDHGVFVFYCVSAFHPILLVALPAPEANSEPLELLDNIVTAQQALRTRFSSPTFGPTSPAPRGACGTQREVGTRRHRRNHHRRRRHQHHHHYHHRHVRL